MNLVSAQGLEPWTADQEATKDCAVICSPRGACAETVCFQFLSLRQFRTQAGAPPVADFTPRRASPHSASRYGGYFGRRERTIETFRYDVAVSGKGIDQLYDVVPLCQLGDRIICLDALGAIADFW